MGIRDRHFYYGLIFQLFLWFVAIRLLIMAVGIKIKVPVLDPIMFFIWGIIGIISKFIFGTIGGWQG